MLWLRTVSEARRPGSTSTKWPGGNDKTTSQILQGWQAACLPGGFFSLLSRQLVLCYCCISWLPTKSMPSAVWPRAISSSRAQGYGYLQAWCFFLVFSVIANYLITTRKGITVIFQTEGWNFGFMVRPAWARSVKQKNQTEVWNFTVKPEQTRL